jgi:hypothetical protein
VPSFQLSDRFGFNTDIEAGPASGLNRYFQHLPDWAIAIINLKTLKDTSWDDSAVLSASGDFSFSSPVTLGTSAATLAIDAAAAGRLAIFVPSTDGAPLFSPDPYGDDIAVPLDMRYVSATLTAKLTTSLSAPVDNLTFGFDGNHAVTFGYHQPFSLATTTPDVLTSLKQTIAEFAIPGDIHDIANMPEGSVATVESSGEIKFSGSVNLLTLANPLASATVPILGDVQVNATAAVTVGAAYHYAGDYQIRVSRLPNSRFRLGIYRRRQSDFTVTANATAGISTSKDSLVNGILGALATPHVDQNELITAGLSPAAADAAQSALKAAVDRTLSIGLSLEIQSAKENEAMFLYEVDNNVLQSPELINSALRGDFSPLTSLDQQLPAGIKIVKSLISSTKTLRHRFKVNLLGIYDALSISSLIRKGSSAFDAESGEYILTDSVTADAMALSADNKKLRTLLAQKLLITAAYRAANLVSGPPTLASRHTWFHLTGKTNRDQFLADLAIGAALGFSEAKPPASLPDQPGRTSALAEASYDDPAFTALFFDSSGELRTESYYDKAGRAAVAVITTDPGRLRPTRDDALWAQMRDNGNPGSAEFRQLLPGVSPQSLNDIGVDYLNIVWWTKAMLDTGHKLNTIRQFLDGGTKSRTDPQFQKLRQDLADQLATLATRTREDFGGPWGLLAMSLAATRKGCRFQLASPIPSLCLNLETPLAPIAIPAQTQGA